MSVVKYTDEPKAVGKVFVDGEDVTARCFAFDAEEGWADCFAKAADGGIDHEKPTARLRGTITTEPYKA